MTRLPDAVQLSVAVGGVSTIVLVQVEGSILTTTSLNGSVSTGAVVSMAVMS